MKRKPIWQLRRTYCRVSDAYANVNKEVGQHLEALHEAMHRRDKMRPKHDRARRELDNALYRQAVKPAR